MEITRLLKLKESGTLEFRETLRMKEEIGGAVSAFSNACGGVILIGITDGGAIKGLDVGKKTTTDLAEYIMKHWRDLVQFQAFEVAFIDALKCLVFCDFKIKKNTDPNIFPDIRVHDVSGGKIISVSVKESHDKPVFSRGRAYKRVGDTTQAINSSEIRALAKESGPKVYWDEEICEGATPADIDDDKVRWFLRKAKFERNVEIEPEMPVREALERLELMKGTKLLSGVLSMD